MKRNCRFFVILAVFALIFGALPAFAIDAYVTVIYRQVDIAFVDRSDSELDGILSKSNEDRNYYLIENYTMKKIRHLIVSEDYEFASEAALVVIDNNLDNMEAVELYSSIAAALEKQKEQRLAIEQRQQAEQARFEAEKAKQRAIIEKDYVSMNTASGNTVYLKEKNENELLNDREKLVKELHDLKLKKVIGVIENPVKIRLIKRDIARINTVLKEKRIEEFKSK